MPAISGTGGYVTIDGAVVAGVRTWSVSKAADTFDAGGFGFGARLTERGLSDWSATFEGNYENDSAQTALWTALTGGAKAVMMFHQRAADYFRGTAVLTGYSPSHSFDGLGGATWSVRGNGPLTRTSLVGRAAGLPLLLTLDVVDRSTI